MPVRRGSGKIIIGETRVTADFNVVNFEDGARWHAAERSVIKDRVPSRPRNLDPRDRTFKVAQSYIRQMVVHLDGCLDADMCWNVLQNERGLSCHFILDNDGTLYQTLNLIDCAYHAAGLNETSIGIEICNRGKVMKGEEDYYPRHQLKPRDVRACFIHGDKYVSFDFTKEQYATMDALGKLLAKNLPGIPLQYPTGDDRSPRMTTIIDEATDPTGQKLRDTYSGYLGHYHITRNKWDPGPFDFAKFLGKLTSRSSFPIGLHDLAKREEVPEDPKALETATAAFYRNNEEEGGGGFFPVGPLEPYRLWHGGVHLHVPEGAKVYAPWAGRIVAARNIANQHGIGSVNFVLLRHTLPVRGATLEFYSLCFHLRHEAEDVPKNDRLHWMSSEQWPVELDARAQVVTFKEPIAVAAGDVIGHVGKAGPDAEPQLHFEIFFTDRQTNQTMRRLDDAGFWAPPVDGADTRFCSAKEILDKIDKRKPKGILDRRELDELFREESEDRRLMRRMVTLHPSEWSNRPDWKQELLGARDLASWDLKTIAELVDEQVTPTLFWEAVEPLRLLASSNVYTYHPITFLSWLNGMLIADRKVGSAAFRQATAADLEDAAQGRVGQAKMDLDDHAGDSFVHADEMTWTPPPRPMDQQTLIDGFGD